jgi:hypothetical protein
MDYLTRRAVSYRDLVAHGVMCGKLNNLLDRPQRWQLECQIVGNITKDEAKRAVENYCRREWDATDFSYFTTAGAKSGSFRVRFTSFAL